MGLQAQWSRAPTIQSLGGRTNLDDVHADVRTARRRARLPTSKADGREAAETSAFHAEECAKQVAVDSQKSSNNNIYNNNNNNNNNNNSSNNLPTYNTRIAVKNERTTLSRLLPIRYLLELHALVSVRILNERSTSLNTTPNGQV
ncbi:unnamed protein product, partial [Ceratitis capitata]